MGHSCGRRQGNRDREADSRNHDHDLVCREANGQALKEYCNAILVSVDLTLTVYSDPMCFTKSLLRSIAVPITGSGQETARPGSTVVQQSVRKLRVVSTAVLSMSFLCAGVALRSWALGNADDGGWDRVW